jgi:tRNA threonylcarbamoyladenosine biosynthesis protein TsaB
VSATTRYDHTAVLTLALDTTTRAGSVAIVRDAEVLAVVCGDAALTHGERLPAEIEQALHAAAMRAADLQLLAVASGPGAFTGLRIGLAAVQGLAMVLNIPVVAVSALDALALSARPLTPDPPGRPLTPIPLPAPPLTPLAAWIDAARGEVFAAFYEFAAMERVAYPGPTSDPNPTSDPAPTSDPVVSTPGALLAALPPGRDVLFVGDGAVKYREQILQHAGGRHCVIAPPAALAPLIAHLGIAAAARGEAGPPHALQPLYVRRPDAELERLRREVR